jgi:hypothetical protein
LQAFDHNTEMFKTKLVEAKRWPKINFTPKEDSFKGVIEEALRVIPLVGPNMQAFPMKEVASISFNLISPIIKQYLSGYLLIVNILAEILKGNFDDKQFGALSTYYDDDIKKPSDSNKTISILESNHNFDLKYIAHYELKYVDKYSENLNKSESHIDSKLKKLKRLKKGENGGLNGEDDLISRQFEMLKNLFEIEEKDTGHFTFKSEIKSSTVEIDLIRERFKRLLNIQNIYEKKVSFGLFNYVNVNQFWKNLEKTTNFVNLISKVSVSGLGSLATASKIGSDEQFLIVNINISIVVTVPDRTSEII